MSATSAPSGAPVNAIRVWTDGLSLFAEIPGAPPYIMRLDLTDSGLSKALDLLRTKAKDTNGHTKAALAAQAVVRPKDALATPDQRQAARDVLRRLKMV